MSYIVYLLRCADNTFYTGITTDITRRVMEHNTSTKGANYTKARRPVTLAYQENQPDRSTAQKREFVIRTLSHKAKESLSHGHA
jgi:putative endonuclease